MGINHIGTKTIFTDRLFLRKATIDDALALCSGLFNQPEFLYYTNKQPVTREQTTDYLKAIQEKYKQLDYYNWVIEEKLTKNIVGMINLRVLDKNNSVEFNYATDNRYTNNGYMTETLSSIINFALNTMKVNRVQGGCAVENIASKRVMEKCGLYFEGTLKKYLKLNDGYHDMHMYAITK